MILELIREGIRGRKLILSQRNVEIGIGTKYYPGCQDVFGPFPSVFLDK